MRLVLKIPVVYLTNNKGGGNGVNLLWVMPVL